MPRFAWPDHSRARQQRTSRRSTRRPGQPPSTRADQGGGDAARSADRGRAPVAGPPSSRSSHRLAPVIVEAESGIPHWCGARRTSRGISARG